jgi:hypothetical protein
MANSVKTANANAASAGSGPNAAKNTLLKNEVNSRRSQRVVARVRVRVSRKEDEKREPETSHTLVVNAHGALLTLVMEVRPEEILAVKNVNSGEERCSRVVRVSGEAATEKVSEKEVAIEFTEPAPHFWKIDFPPADWKTVVKE